MEFMSFDFFCQCEFIFYEFVNTGILCIYMYKLTNLNKGAFVQDFTKYAYRFF